MKKIEVEPIFGIEIECAYKPESIGTIEKGGYHGSGDKTFGSCFIVERDGSLRSSNGYPETMELISVPFAYSKFNKIFDSFIDESITRYKSRKINTRPSSFFSVSENLKNPELPDIYNFNGSMGCHIHVTPLIKSGKKHYVNYKNNRYGFKGKTIDIRSLATDNFLDTIRENINMKIKSNMPHLYGDFVKYYHRSSYSKKGDIKQFKRDRYCEFNLACGNTRFEYRAFHLIGVKTWEEMRKILFIAINTIKECFDNEINKKDAFKSGEDIDITDNLKNFCKRNNINNFKIKENKTNINVSIPKISKVKRCFPFFK